MTLRARRVVWAAVAVVLLGALGALWTYVRIQDDKAFQAAQRQASGAPADPEAFRREWAMIEAGTPDADVPLPAPPPDLKRIVDAYDGYLQEHPRGRHADEARKSLTEARAQLEVIEAFRRAVEPVIQDESYAARRAALRPAVQAGTADVQSLLELAFLTWGCDDWSEGAYEAANRQLDEVLRVDPGNVIAPGLREANATEHAARPRRPGPGEPVSFTITDASGKVVWRFEKHPWFGSVGTDAAGRKHVRDIRAGKLSLLSDVVRGRLNECCARAGAPS